MRFFRLFVTYCLLALLPAGLYLHANWKDLVREGRRGRLEQRMDLQLSAALERARSRRWAVLIGDSSALAVDFSMRPPRRLIFDLATAINRYYGRRQPGPPVVAVMSPGVTVFHAYYLLNLAAGSPVRPRTVIVALNLRSLSFYDRPGFRFNRLAGLIRPREWLRAARLPLDTQGLGFDGVLDAWTERKLGLRPLRLAIAGSRLRARSHMGLPIDKAGRAERNALGLVGQYGGVMEPDHPLLKMWEAVAELADRYDMKLLVYAVPINVEAIARRGLTGQVAADEKLRRFQSVITRYGHRWLDLHAIVPASEFMDRTEHLSPRGLNIVAARLAGALAVP